MALFLVFRQNLMISTKSIVTIDYYLSLALNQLLQ